MYHFTLKFLFKNKFVVADSITIKKSCIFTSEIKTNKHGL